MSRWAKVELEVKRQFTAVSTAVIAVIALALIGLAAPAIADATDGTPPVVHLSGSAVSAVEEEASSGSYELVIAASDGSASEPQSGVAKIEVSVDGSGQQSWEKYCPEGSCELEETWTWTPAGYSGTGHELVVKVTDHAGNVTEEEVSWEGLAEIPQEAAPAGTDTTSPAIAFSGSAVMATLEGATTGGYELRMKATDGSPSEPQSGVAKIEVGVDGTTLQSWEKYCPIGSCRLKVKWPYVPSSYTGSGHKITVTIRDHAGNVTVRTLEPDLVGPEFESPFEAVAVVPPEEPGASVSFSLAADPPLADGSTPGSGLDHYVYRYSLNGGLPTEWKTSSIPYFVAPGAEVGETLSLEVYAVDRVGNEGPVETASTQVEAQQERTLEEEREIEEAEEADPGPGEMLFEYVENAGPSAITPFAVNPNRCEGKASEPHPSTHAAHEGYDRINGTTWVECGSGGWTGVVRSHLERWNGEVWKTVGSLAIEPIVKSYIKTKANSWTECTPGLYRTYGVITVNAPPEGELKSPPTQKEYSGSRRVFAEDCLEG